MGAQIVMGLFTIWSLIHDDVRVLGIAAGADTTMAILLLGAHTRARMTDRACTQRSVPLMCMCCTPPCATLLAAMAILFMLEIAMNLAVGREYAPAPFPSLLDQKGQKAKQCIHLRQ